MLYNIAKISFCFSDVNFSYHLYKYS